MKNKRLKFSLYICAIIVAVVISCYCRNESVSVRCDTVDVGCVAVGDSVCATFKFRNNTYVTQTVEFLPECDCTTVSAKSIKIGPHMSKRVFVKVSVEEPGEFNKYIYAEAAKGDVCFTITVRGFAENK